MLFLYVFSVVWFGNYYKEIYPAATGGGDDADKGGEIDGGRVGDSKDSSTIVANTCHSLISCMITMNLSGVVGDSMTQWEISTFVSDTFHYIFMSILFSKIISGIMTDSFADLRDQRVFIENDSKNTCFICGVHRATVFNLLFPPS